MFHVGAALYVWICCAQMFVAAALAIGRTHSLLTVLSGFERFSASIETTNKIETSKFTKKRAQLQSIVNKK